MKRAYLLLAIAACLSCSTVQKVEIPQGTEVPLILLTELSSGGSQEGKQVAFMVSKDVVSPDHRVLIPKGAIAYGKVTWSRAAGAISKFLNEPARLAVSIDRTVAVDGQAVSLVGTQDKAEKGYRFTGDNTATATANDELERVLSDDETKKALEKMLDGLLGEDMGDSKSVSELAKRLKLSNTEKLADSNSLDDLLGVVKGVGAGEVTRIATGQASLLIDAIAELAGIRKEVGDRISGLFKGRNIKAYPGTPVTAYVATSLTVSAPAPK